MNRKSYILCLLLVCNIVKSNAQTDNPEHLTTQAPTTPSPVSRFISHIGERALDIDDAIYKVMAPKADFEEWKKQEALKSDGEMNYFGRVRRNYELLQKTLRESLDATGDILKNSELMNLNFQNKGNKAFLDVSTPLIPMNVQVKAKNVPVLDKDTSTENKPEENPMQSKRDNPKIDLPFSDVSGSITIGGRNINLKNVENAPNDILIDNHAEELQQRSSKHNAQFYRNKHYQRHRVSNRNDDGIPLEIVESRTQSGIYPNHRFSPNFDRGVPIEIVESRAQGGNYPNRRFPPNFDEGIPIEVVESRAQSENYPNHWFPSDFDEGIPIEIVESRAQSGNYPNHRFPPNFDEGIPIEIVESRARNRNYPNSRFSRSIDEGIPMEIVESKAQNGNYPKQGLSSIIDEGIPIENVESREENGNYEGDGMSQQIDEGVPLEIVEAGVQGRILGDLLFSENTFDQHFRRFLNTHGKWLLDPSIFPPRGIVESIRDMAKTPFNEDATMGGRRKGNAVEVPKQFSMDEMIRTDEDTLHESDYGIDSKIILAFTPGGVPLRLKISSGVDDPLSFLHRILSDAGVSLNIPVESRRRIRPAGNDVLQLGSGLYDIQESAMFVDLSNQNQLNSLVRTLKKYRD